MRAGQDFTWDRIPFVLEAWEGKKDMIFNVQVKTFKTKSMLDKYILFLRLLMNHEKS